MNYSFNTMLNDIFEQNVVEYLKSLKNPANLIIFILDILIVSFLAIKVIKILKRSRAWQLLKGIALLLIITWVSSILKLNILKYILTSFMSYGIIFLIVIFQPELRRALEQLGTDKLTRWFGIDKDIIAKTKEDVYKMVAAAKELSKTKTGALIVIEQDIELRDIISTGVSIGAEVSPQLLVNIFKPKTPLHDGAVIISNRRIIAAACVLPLAGDNDIAKELGTRHRAAIGISKESDAIVIVVSEETGRISIAKNGTLIADLKEEALKQILIKNIVTNRYGEKDVKKAISFNTLKAKFIRKNK